MPHPYAKARKMKWKQDCEEAKYYTLEGAETNVIGCSCNYYLEIFWEKNKCVIKKKIKWNKHSNKKKKLKKRYAEEQKRLA